MKKRKKYLLGIVVVLLLVSGSYYFIKRYPYIATEIPKTIKNIPYSLFRNDIFLQHN